MKRRQVMDKNKGHYKGRERRLGHRVFWCALLILSVLAVTSYVSGCGRHHHKHWEHKDMSAEELKERMDERAERVLKKVDATPEQREEISAVLDGFLPEMVEFREERKVLKERLKKALEAEEINEEEFGQIRAQTRELVGRSVDRSLDTVFEISKVLTPEQRKGLIESWEKRR
jgi:Spy/CpxP family protein refolding chaperone